MSGNPIDRDPGEPFDFGDCVRILGSKVQGFVVACIFHLRREPAYLVEYVDAEGNPQERQWSHDQLALVRLAEAERQDFEEYEEETNVVPIRRVN